MYRLRRWNLEVGALKSVPSSDEEGGRSPEGEKKPKVCTIYRKFVQIGSFFLSLTLRELPHQREPLNCKPLLLNLIDEVDTFTHNSSLITHNSYSITQTDKSGFEWQFSIFNCQFSIWIFRCQLSARLGLLCPNFPNVLHLSLAYLSVLCYTHRGR